MVIVKVGGKEYGGWKSVNISKSVENICGTFSLTVINAWIDDQNLPQIKVGDSVEVFLINRNGDEKIVMTGFVDIETPGFNSTGRYLNISGRDKTCDLVDCTPKNPKSRKDMNPIDLIETLIKDENATSTEAGFDIEVVSLIDKTKFDSDKSDYVPAKDSKFSDEFKKISSRHGFLIYTAEDGVLKIADYSEGELGGKLAEGVNVLSASRSYNMSKVYSRIMVYSQDNDSGGGTDGATKANENKNKDSDTAYEDDTIRYRPLNVISTDSTNTTSPAERGLWINNVNKAKSRQINVEVQGWDTENGDLYSINKEIIISLPSLAVDTKKQYMIKEVKFKMSEGGKTTDLILVHKNAYNPLGDLTVSEENSEDNSFTDGATKANK